MQQIQIISQIKQLIRQLKGMREPTTIQQYKQFCKALKLKILKQKSTIESQGQQIDRLNNEIKILKKSTLQPRNQNNENSPYSSMNLQIGDKTKMMADNVDTETFHGKLQVMNKFKYGACSFGITPESIFRIADIAYKGEVQADYFRQVLAKIQLGLTPMEISCLIYIFDQNCSGYIHRDDYNDALNAYRLSLQQSYLHYTSACLQKLAKLFETQRIQVLKYFQQMQGRTVNSVDLNKFAQKLRSTFGKRLQSRQIMGAFNAIDLENDGIVCKKNFVYSLTAAMNKLTNLSSVKKSNSFQEHQNNLYKSNLSNKKSQPNNNSTINDNINENSSIKPPPMKQEQVVSQQILEKLQKTNKVTLHQIYEEICRFPIRHRLTLMQFKKILSQLDVNPKISSELGSLLFRSIDINRKGTIFFNQLMNYYLHHQTDMSIVFHLISKYFQINDLNADRFWFLYGVTSDSDITKAKFMEIMSKSFGTGTAGITTGPQSYIWDKFWAYFDKGRGIVSVANINKQLNKYDSSE